MHNFKKILSFFLILSIVFGSSFSAFALPVSGIQFGNGDTEVNNFINKLSDTQINAYRGMENYDKLSGLIGFDGDYSIDDKDEEVSVIVLFKNQPAATAQVNAALKLNRYMSLKEAESLVEKDHIKFKEDLDKLFGSEDSMQRTARKGYKINQEYRRAINGVSIDLPASMLEEISRFDSVRAIYPNMEASVSPIRDNTVFGGDKSGMAEGRKEMNVDLLHEENITGEGITICVIDTGIDYNHPDFEGAFATKSPSGDSDELKDGFFYGRNFLVDYDSNNFPDYPGRDANDPMETTFEGWDKDAIEYATSHGTHVAGTIAARDKNSGTSALGVAPDSTIYAYRVLGPGGSGPSDIILRAIEQVPIDKPDVVNMSLGVGINDPYFPTSLAVNNIVVQDPDITFVIAAGNSGPNPASLGSPGTSAAAITVANAGLGLETYTMTVSGDSGAPYDISLFYMDQDSNFELDEESGKYYSTYEALTPVDGTNFAYEVIKIPKLSDVDGSVPDLGTGTEEEFEAIADEIEGKIVIVARGSEFAKTAEFARSYNAGGVILVDHAGENLGYDYRGRDSNYLPFFTMNYSEGIGFLNEFVEDKYTIYFDNFTENILPSILNPTSSRGPVMTTYEIKPDVSSHGTNVLSTVPYFMVPSENGAYEGGTPGDYRNAYDRYSGTSMASPHVAGVVALLKEYSLKNTGEKWKSDEIKARLMNSGKLLGEPYGVNEIGAGFVDAYSAVHSNVYITVKKDDVPIDGSVANDASFDTAAFSFGLAPIGEEKEQTVIAKYATIHNNSETNKIFKISRRFNTEGQNVKNVEGTGIDLLISNKEISVAPGSTMDFSVTMSVPAGLDSELAGYYDGYVILENAEDSNEVYNLPFMINCMDIQPVLEEGNFFINRPVISTGENKQQRLSSTIDFYYNQSQGGYYLLEIYANDENYDIDNLENSNWLGFFNTQIDAIHLPTDTWFYQSISDGTYTTVNEAGNDYVDVEFEEGLYKIVIKGYNENFDYEYLYDMDLLVDNTKPSLEINNFNTGGYNSIYVEEGSNNVTITGNVYDNSIEILNDNDIKFEIWEEGDVMPRIPDQSYNTVVVAIGDEAYKADVDGITGDFTVDIDLSGNTLPIKAKIYAVDGFSIMDITSKNIDSTTRFNPKMPSFVFGDSGNKYGYVGSNIISKDFYIEASGPQAMILPDSINMFVGDTKEIETIFNAAAMGDQVKYYESDNPEVVFVANTGGNSTTITALNEGKATIKAHTKNGLVAECSINVPTMLGSGVEFKTGDYIYYGSINHATGVTPGFSWFPATVDRDEEVSPIIWKIMGEEIEDGEGDGYLSLLSKYVIDAKEFSSFSSAYHDLSSSSVFGTTIKHYLNGGKYLQAIDDEGNYEIKEYDGPIFWDNFSKPELKAIPLVVNEIPLYDFDGNYLPEYSFTVENERIYLPWIVNHTVGDIFDFAYSIYWSAGKDLDSNNSMMYKTKNVNNNLDIVANYKNGNPATYWTEIPVADFTVNTIVNIGADSAADYRDTIPFMGIMASQAQGIRPGMKIDPEDIVFAYEINNSGEEGTILPDDINYIIEENDEARYFKLSVIGENEGRSIGEINGLEKDYNIGEGSDLTIEPNIIDEDFDIIAYKIVDENNELVKYGEITDYSSELVLDTKDLLEDNYKVYIWPQKNNEINSNETGVVSSFNLYVTDALVGEIVLSQEELTIGVNESKKLFAEIYPVSANFRELSWSSSDNSVATVELDGTVIGHSEGETIITATAMDGSDVYAEVTVNVVQYVEEITLHLVEEVESTSVEYEFTEEPDFQEEIEELDEEVEILEDDVEIIEEDNIVLEEIVDDLRFEKYISDDAINSLELEAGARKGLVAKINPEDATNKELIWTSTDESVAVYDEEAEEVIAKGEGVAAITAMATDGSGVFASCIVNVDNSYIIMVKGISFDNTKLELDIGDEIPLTTEITPENASIKDIIWSSSDENIVTVDEYGSIKAVRAGEATIKAITVDGGYHAEIKVVVSGSITQVGLNRSKLRLAKNESFQLNTIIVPAGGLVTSEDWFSSDEDVAVVDEEGMVTAKSPGEATISVKINDNEELVAECELEVFSTIESIEIVGEDRELIRAGAQETLSILIDGEEASNEEVKWTSSRPDIVKVNDNGVVTAVNGGTANIKATSKDGSGVFDTIAIKVILPVESISIQNDEGIDYTNGTFYLENTPYSFDSLFAFASPFNADDKSINWENSNPDIVKMEVDSFNSNAAMFYPLKNGSATITASSSNGSVWASTTIVVRPPIARIIIQPEGPVDMKVGDTKQFTYTVLPEGADNDLVWETYSDIISIDEKGMVTANEPGTATIHVRDKNWTKYSETVTINVVGGTNIVSIGKLADIKVPYGTKFENITLPKTVKVSLENGEVGYVDLVWDKGNYDGTVPGKYSLIGKPQLEGTSITNTEELTAIVNIIVEDKSTSKPDPRPEPKPEPKPVPVPKPERKPELKPEPKPEPKPEKPEEIEQIIFKDITNHWAKDDIMFVANEKLVNGIGNNLFDPNGTMTRGMFVTILGRYADINIDDYVDSRFIDVDKNIYYAPYIEWAAEKGIVEGVGKNKFAPDTPVTREQMAVILMNYINTMGVKLPEEIDNSIQFKDTESISYWAVEAVDKIKNLNIIRGRDNGNFDPQGIATRAEVSTVFARFIRMLKM